MERRTVDAPEMLGATVHAVTAAIAEVYERRIRKLRRQLDKARARAAIRDAEQVLQAEVATLLHNEQDETR